MHKESFAQMKRILERFAGQKHSVLDVGSMDVNGNYRGLVEGMGWSYVGLDLAPGKNVDIVVDDPYDFGIQDCSYSLVISGSTMEHVKSIWRWVPELARVTSIEGHVVILTHTSWELHRYPVDCWRIMPDGMRHLFDECGNLIDYDIQMYNSTDISGVATKYRK